MLRKAGEVYEESKKSSVIADDKWKEKFMWLAEKDIDEACMEGKFETKVKDPSKDYRTKPSRLGDADDMLWDWAIEELEFLGYSVEKSEEGFVLVSWGNKRPRKRVGLQDKNGVDIRTGDYLKFTRIYKSDGGGTEEIEIVSYEEFMFLFGNIPFHLVSTCDSDHVDCYLEVIGNIWDDKIETGFNFI